VHLAQAGEFVVVDDQRPVASTDDRDDPHPGAVQGLSDRMDHRRVNAAADAYRESFIQQMGRGAERPGHLADRSAYWHGHDRLGSVSHPLDHPPGRAGRRLTVAWSCTPLPPMDERSLLLVSGVDVTDRRQRELELHPYLFDRRFLFRVLSMGHSQFAELIGARGPNTQVNAACASTTQAISIAHDWIRAGRCRRPR